MTILLAALAQLLHVALMLAAAPVVASLQEGIEARLVGRAGPSPRQGWRDLIRLMRKQPALAENASPLMRAAPLACFAAAVVAVSLVPSFALGMTLAPLADLLVIAGLLGFGRLVLALAAMDAGTGLAGLAAARVASLGCFAEPALFLVFVALGLLGGTTNLDLLIGLQLQGMLQPVAASALAAFAMAVLALSGSDMTALAAEFSAGDLALIEIAEVLRRLAWLNLLIDLFLPLGIAAPGAGPLGWLLGLLARAVMLGVLVAAAAALRSLAGFPERVRPALASGIAAAIGLLAAMLTMASAVAA